MSIFSKIFGTDEVKAGQQGANYQFLRMLNGYENVFVPWTGKAYDDLTVRTCIDAISRHIAKMKPKHVRRAGDGSIVETNSTLDSLISSRPNEYMSTYDFLYKVASQYYSYNNAFVYIQTDNRGNITGLYPLDFDSIELKESGGIIFCKFNFLGTGTITVPYTDIIHLRRHFNRADFFGESNEKPLKQTLQILNTVKQALVNAVKNSAKLRGIIKYLQKLRPEDMEKQTKAFVDTFLNTEKSSGGVGAIDNSMEYQQLTTSIETADYGQMRFVRDDIYRYFGVSEGIIQSKYTENEFTAFYESVLEPFAVQCSLEFTSKIFTEREKGHGNEVEFLTNRLQYASLKSKIAMVQALQPTGNISTNEARELFGYAGVEGGDKRQVSLNFVDASKQNKYQIGEDDTKGGDGGAE